MMISDFLIDHPPSNFVFRISYFLIDNVIRNSQFVIESPFRFSILEFRALSQSCINLLQPIIARTKFIFFQLIEWRIGGIQFNM